MAESLFDVVYSGYSTPIATENLKAKTAYDQILTQTAQQELKMKQVQTQALQSIWGPNGTFGAQQAIANPTDADAQRLAATAELMFKTGNVAEGSRIMTSMSEAQTRQINAKKAQAEEIQKRNQTIGGIMGAIDSQETYSAALPQLQEAGLDLTKLGLSGSYTNDADKLRFYARSSLTSNQQITLDERQRAADNLQGYRNARLGQIDTALGYQDAKLKQAQQRIDDQSTYMHHRMHEDALRDARAQEGLDYKTLKDKDRQASNAARPQQVEIKAAQSIFATDDRTTNIPETLRNGLSQMAVLRAKRKLADQLRSAPAGSTYEQEDFDSALEQTMQEMEQEGMFKPSKLGGTGLFGTGTPEYKHVPPSTTGSGPKAQGKPTAPAPALNAQSYNSAADVAAAMRGNKITYDQAAAILKERGWAGAK